MIMKTPTFLLVLFLGLWTAAAQPTNPVIVTATNTVSGTNAAPAVVSETIQPLINLLGGAGTWITTLIAWLGAISLAMAPFTVWVQHKLADAMNRAAESKEDTTDDEYLRKLFSHSWYKFLTFLARFANFRFPTLSDLERALKLQAEAVKEAVNPNPFDDTTKKV